MQHMQCGKMASSTAQTKNGWVEFVLIYVTINPAKGTDFMVLGIQTERVTLMENMWKGKNAANGHIGGKLESYIYNKTISMAVYMVRPPCGPKKECASNA